VNIETGYSSNSAILV